uniref:Golgin subfamily A member 1 n=1 Tax=Photinus pyralis TaxID=7054 RepID=A0A1Y1KKD8_PHOPY
MFASLKNKIREETGSDISKLTAKITSTAQRIESLRGRSQQGSTSSINSLVSSEGNRDETADGTKIDEDYKKRFNKLETEYAIKLEEKTKEWQGVLYEKDKKIQKLEKDQEDAFKQINSLRSVLKSSEEMQKRLVEHREDKEQIENFQTQEISKIKHLVLLREKELAEKSSLLKDTTQQLEKMRAEVTRLRKQEECLTDVQHDTGTEMKAVRKNLENTESQLDKSEDECSKLRLSVDSEHQANTSLRQLVAKLEKELGEEKSTCLNVQKTLSRVTSEKNAALLRNAEISQQMEIAKQECRRQDTEMTELVNKISALEGEMKIFKDKEAKSVEQDLKNTIIRLEEQVTEKNKTIKTLQLRLADIKKTLQQELRTPGSTNYHTDIQENNSAAVLMPSHTSTKQHSIRKDDDDINFKYLKHVLIKFLTSREYEAQHLIRAVSTLLKFSPEEEKLLHETLEWRMSWFAPKPRVANGQLATSIPPS